MRSRPLILALLLVVSVLAVLAPQVRNVYAPSTTCTYAPTNTFANMVCSLNVTSGDTVLVYMWAIKSLTFVTPTDSQSNSATNVVAQFCTCTQVVIETTLYKFVASATGSDTVTEPLNQNQQGMIVVDYTGNNGIGATHSLDQSGLGSPVTSYSNAITTVQSNTMVSCLSGSDGAFISGWTPGAGETNRVTINGAALAYGFMDDFQTTAAGSYSCNSTWTGADRLNNIAVEVKTLPPLDYTLSVSGAGSSAQNPVVVIPASSGAAKIVATLVQTPAPATFSCTSPPAGISCSFSPASCTPTCSTTLTLTVAQTVVPAFYQVTVTASPLGASTQPVTVWVHVVDQLSAAALGIAAFAILLILGVAYFLYSGGGRKKRRR